MTTVQLVPKHNVREEWVAHFKLVFDEWSGVVSSFAIGPVSRFVLIMKSEIADKVRASECEARLTIGAQPIACTRSFVELESTVGFSEFEISFFENLQPELPLHLLKYNELEITFSGLQGLCENDASVRLDEADSSASVFPDDTTISVPLVPHMSQPLDHRMDGFCLKFRGGMAGPSRQLFFDDGCMRLM